MKLKFLFIVIVLGVYCCNNTKKYQTTSVSVSENGNVMYTVSINSLTDVRKIIPISNLVEDCRLVQLENIEDALVYPSSTTITEKYIGVWQTRNGGGTFKLFDRSGKFLCTLGSDESGTGEYSFSVYCDCIIDDENELIYLAEWITDRIYVFHSTGKLMKEFIFPKKLHSPVMFLSGDTLTVVRVALNNPFPKNYWYQADKVMIDKFNVNTGELLEELPPPAHLIINGDKNDGAIFTSRNLPETFDVQLHYYFTKSSYRDTLYHIDMKNNKIIPFFTVTYNELDITPIEQQPLKPFFYYLNENVLMAYINGKGLVATDLKSRTSSWVLIVNDYYGNIPVPTWPSNFRNGYFVQNLKPEELKKIIETQLAERRCTENDIQVLKKMLSNLQEGANNVVFIGKLKSETELW